MERTEIVSLFKNTPADGDLGAVGGGVLEQRNDLGTFHNVFPPENNEKRQLCSP